LTIRSWIAIMGPVVTGLKARKPSGSMQRRYFFRSFLGQAVSVVGEIRGRPQLSLEELGRLPDTVVRTMRPVRDKLGPYSIEGSELVLKRVGSAEREVVYAFGAWELDVIARFDGRSTLWEIAQAHASSQKVHAAAAYHGARSLFIALASYLVCRPSDAHERVEPSS
jgi:hypothetical protein